MSDLLTHDEYRAIARGLRIEGNAFIDGAFRPAQSGRQFATLNPASGEHLADVAACDGSDVDLAVARARSSFDEGHWSRCPPGERKAVLLRLAKLMERSRNELAVLESLDSGKPIRDIALIDLPDAIHTLRWHAETIDKLYDLTAPARDDAIAMIVREPIGVVGLVLPWNFPLLMLAWKIGPALAAGCSVVCKPAEQTPLSALRVAELAIEAGLPRGVFNVVTGNGPEVGEPLGRHPDVDMVSFTGSTETGRRFLRYAADSNLKKVVLECGGKNPALVLDDAEPLDRVAGQIVQGAFWNMGENCSATSRLIVQRGVKARLLDLIATRLQEWHVGDPLDPRTRIGALVDAEHHAKVSRYLQLARPGQIVAGGTTTATHVAPTVIDGVASADPLAQEEIFGPVLCVITVDTVDQALQAANDTPYGLAASVYGRDGRTTLRLARAIRAGTVTINSFGEGDATTPFGGYRQSGFGGRDKSVFAHDQYTELKSIWVDLGDPARDDTLA
jgi:gamma-glutamyl-gamma-aminobutyraldehyde dehydrogenase